MKFTSTLIIYFSILFTNNIFAQADFIIDSYEGCAPLEIFCTDLSIDATSWSWTASGPNSPPSSSGAQNATFTLIDTGTHTITLTINNGESTATKTVRVGLKPSLTASVTPTNICLNELVTGTATSDYPQTEFTWLFESPSGFVNGGIGSTSIATYTYEDQWSDFNAILIGNSNGCRDTVENEVTINPPGASFNYEIQCLPSTEVRFIPSVAQGSFGDYFEWNIIDGPNGAESQIHTGTNVNTANFTYDFENYGTYKIEFFTSSSFTGCSDNVIKTIVLNDFSNYDIITTSNSSDCPPLNTEFSVEPSLNSNEINSIEWYFEASNLNGNVIGDLSASNITSNVPWIYTSSGLDDGFYDVQIVYSTANCSYSIYKDDFIYVGLPEGSYTIISQDSILPAEVVFVITTQCESDVLIDFGDGNTSTITANGIDTVTYIYQESGNFEVVMNLVTSNGDSIEIFNSDRLGEPTFIDIIDETTSLLSSELESQILVYPNPAHKYFEIQIPNQLTIEKIQLINPVGQIISTEFNPNNRFLINDLESGLYLLLIETSKGNTEKRLQILK